MSVLFAGFMACVIDDKAPLRFVVGDKVRCRTSKGWQQGEIMRWWDEGNTYRVKLNDKRKTEIWAPIDDDVCIRVYKPAAAGAGAAEDGADAAADE